jgi:hypothetical protein
MLVVQEAVLVGEHQVLGLVVLELLIRDMQVVLTLHRTIVEVEEVELVLLVLMVELVLVLEVLEVLD